MFNSKKPFIIWLGTLFILVACATDSSPLITSTAATVIPSPTATATALPPTPSSPKDSILWDGLQVIMDGLEITQDYINATYARKIFCHKFTRITANF